MNAISTLLLILWWMLGLGVIPVFLKIAGITLPYSGPEALDVWISLGVFF